MYTVFVSLTDKVVVNLLSRLAVSSCYFVYFAGSRVGVCCKGVSESIAVNSHSPAALEKVFSKDISRIQSVRVSPLLRLEMGSGHVIYQRVGRIRRD